MSYSVIIPFRNEDKNLLKLINSFKQLDMSALNVEFIFVNDHSTDQFQEICKHVKFKFVSYDLPHGQTGKKAALTYGIEKANGEIIVTTDADCEVPSGWVREAILLFGGKPNTTAIRGGGEPAWMLFGFRWKPYY
jgi:glycosyltransferase involved in cell wall biosynthesis